MIANGALLNYLNGFEERITRRVEGLFQMHADDHEADATARDEREQRVRARVFDLEQRQIDADKAAGIEAQLEEVHKAYRTGQVSIIRIPVLFVSQNKGWLIPLVRIAAIAGAGAAGWSIGHSPPA